MFDALYRNARCRVAELTRSLTAEQLDARVCGSPEWTGRQVVAHLAGVAADISTGNMTGAPGPAWTAAQVDGRAGRALEELLAEWDAAGPAVEAALAERRSGSAAVLDVLAHECDLREQFGLDPAPIDQVEAAAMGASKAIVTRFAGPGTLVVRCSSSDGVEHEWTGGDGGPRAEVGVGSYELFRALVSRRSRRQILAWGWRGDADPAPIIEQLPVFGCRDDDVPA
ncbi:MAG TPA: maleylpyruvate isomerase N-terminal domain-containing protein [Pseudonocardiaceae bacterium]